MNSSHLILLGSFVGATAVLVAWKEFKTNPGDELGNSPAAISPVEGGTSSISPAGLRSSGKRPKQSPFSVSEMLTLNDDTSIQSLENIDRLKAQSKRRLKQLEQSLFLSPDQSREIYSLIARSSPLFTTGIAVNGSNQPAISPTVASGDIHDLLNPNQQEDFVDDLLAEKEWWDELVVNLEAEIDADLTPSSPDSNQNQSPKTEETQNPFNLFKTLSD